MLTRKENLLRVLRHEMPEWIPITGHVDPYNQPGRDGMDPVLADQLANVRWGDESTVRFSQYLEIDVMDWFSPPVRRRAWSELEVEHRREDGDTTTIWHTPLGELRQVQRQCRADGTSYCVEHFVKSADDLPILAAVLEHETVEVDADRQAELVRRRALIGDDGIISFPLPGTPLGMMLRVYAGIETTAYLTVDAPEALRDLFAVMEENHLRQYRLAASMDGELLIGVDDTSTTTQSPAMFEAFNLHYTDHVTDAVHAFGKYYYHHSCGLIRGLVGLYRRTKMDGVHAFQVPPIGDIMVAEGKAALGPGIVIMATLNQLFGSMSDWEWVCGSVRAMFEGAAPGDNFVLGLAGEPSKTMAETQRLLEECRPYQQLGGV